MSDTSEKLEPCPFCHSIDVGVWQVPDDWTVICADCKARGPFGNGPDERADAIRRWNRSATALPDVREALEHARALIQENRDNCYDGYLVRFRGDPDYGGLDDEGKEEIAPYDTALAKIDAALASPPIAFRRHKGEE